MFRTSVYELCKENRSPGAPIRSQKEFVRDSCEEKPLSASENPSKCAPRHVKVWGSASVPSNGRFRYFVAFYDEKSHKFRLTFLQNKSDTYKGIGACITKSET